MKKKLLIGAVILLLLVCLVPIPLQMKDGGTVVYQALLWQAEDVHRLTLTENSETDYLEGTIVRILGIEVYNDVQ